MHSVKLALLSLVAVGAVACSGGQLSPSMVGPSALGASSMTASAPGGAFSALDDSRVPGLVIRDGISCPSDAPQILVGSLGTRIDVEWSPIPRVQGYQVSIEMQNALNGWDAVQTLETTRVRAEWNGAIGHRYRVRVRSRVCSTFGNWSVYEEQSINEPYMPPPAVIEEEPCLQETASRDGRSSATMIDECAPPCEEWTWEAGRVRTLGEGPYCWVPDRVTHERR